MRVVHMVEKKGAIDAHANSRIRSSTSTVDLGMHDRLACYPTRLESRFERNSVAPLRAHAEARDLWLASGTLQKSGEREISF